MQKKKKSAKLKFTKNVTAELSYVLLRLLFIVNNVTLHIDILRHIV